MGINLTAFAQQTLSGQVIDSEEGTPLPGASIRAGAYQGTTTNASGRFTLTNVPASVENLEISFVGFETVRISTKNFPQNTPIPLKRSVFNADEVIVSATRVNDRSGMAYSNVSAEAIEKQNLGQDIPVMLNFTPCLLYTSRCV